MKYYLGLDLSLSGSGVVVLDSDSNVLRALTIKNNLRGMERINHILRQVVDVVEDWEFTVVTVEDYAMGAMGNTFSIGELGGVIKHYLYTVEIDPILVSPTRLKKFITGKGVAEKDMIMMCLYKNFGYEAPDNNQADAYGLAKMAMILDTEDYTGLTKPQIEAITDTINPPVKKKKKQTEHMVAKPRVKKVPVLKRRG